MATPRKRYFRVADAIARAPIDNDTLATGVRLMAHLNTRWARDHIDHDMAGQATLRIADVMAITGKRRADTAMKSLGRWADFCEMSARRLGDVVEIDWPKYAEFQEFRSRSKGQSASVPSSGNKRPPPTPPSGGESAPTGEPGSRRAKTQQNGFALDGEPEPKRTPAEILDSKLEQGWPRLRARALELGATPTLWPEQLTAKHPGRTALRARIRDKRSYAECIEAIEGYHRGRVQRGGEGFDGLAHFAPQTVFSTKLDTYIGLRGLAPSGASARQASQRPAVLDEWDALEGQGDGEV